MIVCSSYLLQSALLDLLENVASGGFVGVLHGCAIGLFQNSLSLTSQTTTSDLTLANYDTYAPITGLTWGTPYVQADGSFAVSGPVCQFQPTSSTVTTPNSIAGYYVYSSTSGNPLLFAELFDSPLPISSPQDAILISPQFSLSPSSGAYAEIWN